MEQEMKNCPYCGEEILAVAKKCKHCGEWLYNDEEQKEDKEMVLCPVCGELIDDGITQCPHCKESIAKKEVQESGNENNTTTDSDNKTRSFFDYYFVEPFVKHYFKFKGRINRKHYWISILLWYAISALLITISIMLDHAASKNAGHIMMYIIIAWFVGSIIPIWAIDCRRMRDGDSELSVWAWCAYIFGSIFLLWWLVKPSDNILRDDGLAPDEQPKVTFMKLDKIVLALILALIIGCFCLSFTSNDQKDVNDNTNIEQIVNDNTKELSEIKIQDPYVEECSDQEATIKAIVSNDKYTFVSFRIVPKEDNTWITISENTYIETEFQKLKLIDAGDIPISPEKRFGLMAGEEYYFYLYFSPLPKGTEKIDIYEEDNDAGWRWLGVHLK